MIGRISAVNHEILVLLSRIATVLIAGVALGLAFEKQRRIYELVSYAWAGLGASFGPPLLLALRWKKTTGIGVFVGMLSGTLSTIYWKDAPEPVEALDIKLASFLISLACTVLVSLATENITMKAVGRVAKEYLSRFKS